LKPQEELPLKRVALILVLSSALVGMSAVTKAQDPKPTAPDNSAVNVRDRAPEAVTADQQSNSKDDVALTTDIRRAVVKDQSLSMMAHNVKIVSVNGKVILRGPVKTEEEKTAIASKAQAIAGAGNVDNQLEVKSQ
jgi:hyperosmotically inducible protein